jgi:hypothetical protein
MYPPSEHGSAPSAPRGLPSQRARPGLPSPGVPAGVPPPRESPAGRSEQDKDGHKPTPGLNGTDHGRLDDEDQPGVEPDVQLAGPVVYEDAAPSWLSQRAHAAARGLTRFGSALLAIALRAPIETIAILVLGVGAAIYPPMWLIGALIVVISRKWDLRDKWLGLSMPVVVVIFGATLAIVLGGQHTSLGSYAFEAWLAAGRLSRIAAVLSASYLLWRVYKGPRDPRRPPWSVPRSR